MMCGYEIPDPAATDLECAVFYAPNRHDWGRDADSAYTVVVYR